MLVRVVTSESELEKISFAGMKIDRYMGTVLILNHIEPEIYIE